MEAATRAPAGSEATCSFSERSIALLSGCVVSTENEPSAPPSLTSVQCDVPLSLKERLRTSSAYRPPSTEWLMSSRIAPYIVGGMCVRRFAASTSSVFAPADAATCAPVSAKCTTWTSSAAPLNPAPTVNGAGLSPDDVPQALTSSAVLPASVPHDPAAGAIGAGSPSTYRTSRCAVRSSVTAAWWNSPSATPPDVALTSIVPIRALTRPPSTASS